MEYEKAYVFQPDGSRSSKRRRLEPQGMQASWDRRKGAYRSMWHSQQARFNARISNLHLSTIKEISLFLDDARNEPQSTKIPAGIVLAGPHASLGSSLIQLQQRFKQNDTRRSFVSLSSSSASNLKALLKSIIQRATARASVPDDDDDDLGTVQTSHGKGPRMLSYDLQLLHDYVRERNVQQVIIALEDTEAFDGHLLSELIDLLGCWSDRIPFVFLLSIATSVGFLQQRLSRAATKTLAGRLFEAPSSEDEVERAFDTMIDDSVPIWIGSGLASVCHERHTDYIHSVEEFTDAIQYGYMCCYYANALSLFLAPKITSKEISHDHCEAVRSLDSFRAFCRKLLANNERVRVRDMLESDAILFGAVRELVSQGRAALSNLTTTIDVIRSAQSCLPNTPVSARCALYLQAMSGKLNGAAMLRTLLLTIRKAPSDTVLSFLEVLPTLDIPFEFSLTCKTILKELRTLLDSQQGNAQPLRSEDDVKNSTLRTTVVAQKVELSKQKSSLSKEDAAYTTLLRRFTDALEEYFAKALINPKDLVFHEIFVYDSKSPHREVFTARPRHAVERALATPHDYLDCECCAPEKVDGDEATLASSQPATAILYQLYLESGSLINVSDLWQAFRAVLGEEHDEQKAMALFQRALAELRYLGLVKSTRKRTDHIAKAAWRGL